MAEKIVMKMEKALIKTALYTLLFLIVVEIIAYFGFFREGCVCAVGSVQNISLALFNPVYTIPITAVLFFIIPPPKNELLYLIIPKICPRGR